jgi:hypothetical protein
MNIRRRFVNGVLVEHTIDGVPQPLTNKAPKHSSPQGKLWPLSLRALKILATPDDRGAGDIIARTIGPIGGEAFKKWWKLVVGRDCGCAGRQDKLNALYPL